MKYSSKGGTVREAREDGLRGDSLLMLEGRKFVFMTAELVLGKFLSESVDFELAKYAVAMVLVWHTEACRYTLVSLEIVVWNRSCRQLCCETNTDLASSQNRCLQRLRMVRMSWQYTWDGTHMFHQGARRSSCGHGRLWEIQPPLHIVTRASITESLSFVEDVQRISFLPPSPLSSSAQTCHNDSAPICARRIPYTLPVPDSLPTNSASTSSSSPNPSVATAAINIDAPKPNLFARCNNGMPHHQCASHAPIPGALLNPPSLSCSPGNNASPSSREKCPMILVCFLERS